ncbi:SSL2 DNA or RNA helicases of superfamily II [uncultured Caudovirales phage]|uniref:SSL2 DNA or RNA helicases of superfamily II n=1 Tax=uncultured Caudovirales phage TaxID=2100421 RepID=A0A6J5M7U7_9CAUD|nr:SSL2 DNA or RNA helicases of superfamily II [uncultured Caudovirales phage]
MEKLIAAKLDEVYLQVSCEPGVARELVDYFSFYVPGYRFMPAYRMRMWDGKLRLFNLMNYTLYLGLLPYLKEFCNSREYEIVIDSSLDNNVQFSDIQCKNFLNSLLLPFEARDYQVEAIQHSIKNHRALLLSPTGSGKSLIIYALTQYYNKKTLIIVPTISLVSQMFSDFQQYAEKNSSIKVDSLYHCIYGGQDKNTSKKFVISTWQSIHKLPKSWFDQFEVVITDEVHLAKAKSLTGIMTKLDKTKYRFGTTGTLDGTQTHKLVLEGLFGSTFSVTTTKTLMDKKQLAELSIDCVVLKYSETSGKFVKSLSYQDEIKFLVQHDKRNKFISNLAISTQSNCLVIFQLVELHGKVLHKIIKEKLEKTEPNRKVFFVSGQTEAEDREQIRHITEKEKNAIIVASSGVFSTGINIKNLENIIFASPTKSRIKTLQSIGRTLRIGDYSDKAKLYDIVDDLTYKSYKNFAIKHFLERVKIYNQEKFKYRMCSVKLEN